MLKHSLRLTNKLRLGNIYMSESTQIEVSNEDQGEVNENLNS